MPHPKVKISDDSGNAVAVTSNALDVNIAGGSSIDIGDVDMFLDGGTAILGGAGVLAPGVLRVTLATDDTLAGVAYADDDDWTDGSSKHLLVGGLFKGSPNTISDGDVGPLWVNANGALKVDVIELTPGVGTLNLCKAEDGPHIGGSAGVMAFGVRNDTLASLVSDDGDYASLQVNDIGALYVTTGSKQNVAVVDNGIGIMGEAKTIDGSTLPNTVGEGSAARLAMSRSGIAFTCLTDPLGASDLGTTITTHLSEIEGAVETIEGAIGGSEMQVDIVSSATLTVDGSGVTQPVSGTVEILGHGAVVHFALNVRNAGNGGPTQLTSQGCKYADIMANLSNTGVIYIGASGVGVTTGIALNAGDVYSVDITNTNLLYALAIVDNEDINVVTYG